MLLTLRSYTIHLPNFSATTGGEAGNVEEVRGDITDLEKTMLEASNVGAKPTQEDKLPIASFTDFSIEKLLDQSTRQVGKKAQQLRHRGNKRGAKVVFLPSLQLRKAPVLTQLVSVFFLYCNINACPRHFAFVLSHSPDVWLGMLQKELRLNNRILRKSNDVHWSYEQQALL